MQSHKEDTSRKLEEMERNLHEGAPQGPDLYLLGRIYSILGIRPRHTGLPGQAYPLGLAWPVRQARLFVRLVGTTGCIAWSFYLDGEMYTFLYLPNARHPDPLQLGFR